MPSLDELEEYRQAIHNCHPVLHNVWGTMDGLKCSIEQAPDGIIQSRYYNGWKSGHFVTAVLFFAPDGTIPAAFYNLPGCCHDSQLADWRKLYEKLEAMYVETGLKFVIDSAFSSKNVDYLIKSSQDYLTADDGLDTYEEQVANLAVKQEATSMRQSAEWGMRAIQSSFPRLKDTLHYEEHGEQRLIFSSLFLIYNLRAHLVGLNQLQNVYFPILRERNANIEFATPIDNLII